MCTHAQNITFIVIYKSSITFKVFYLLGNKGLNKRMKTIDVIRLENAYELQEDAGGQAQIVELTGKSQSQISQIMGKKPIKPIGKIIARELEKLFDKPAGWMDIDHSRRESGHQNPEDYDFSNKIQALSKPQRAALMAFLDSMKDAQ